MTGKQGELDPRVEEKLQSMTFDKEDLKKASLSKDQKDLQELQKVINHFILLKYLILGES